MAIKFWKYQGTGNDFIMIDDREDQFNPEDQELIRRLCDRRFGIGADGLILLRNHNEQDFRMIYFNADGKEGSMCGNGGRCTVSFANKLGLIDRHTSFLAADGLHMAEVMNTEYIRLKMNDVKKVDQFPGHYILDTGSPHYVIFTEDAAREDVAGSGRAIRYSDAFSRNGINVNFVSEEEKGIFVRTYERGVEDETYSCGTGVVASAICAVIRSNADKKSLSVRTLGGILEVSMVKTDDGIFRDVYLSGPAKFVYQGEIESLPAVVG